jgi:hypothetical protein
MTVAAPFDAARTATARRAGRSWRLALALFVLAPFVGEFLLGNQPLSQLPALILLAPMYGGGALLVREVARRTGRGWPTMVLLAAAYGLLEEGPIDQMLFNPGYLGLPSFADLAPMPGGTSAALIEATLTLHTVWSICVPIALIESIGGEDTRPWLGRRGLATTAVVFVGGSTFLGVAQAESLGFVASPGQFTGCAIAIVGLVAVAWRIRRRDPSRDALCAPSPLSAGVFAFVVSGLYWAESVFVPESVSPWLSAVWWFVPAAVSILVVVRWSHRTGWGRVHRLALAGGALLTYCWVGFANAHELDGVSLREALAGNVIFVVVALAILGLAIRRIWPGSRPEATEQGDTVRAAS